jgi:general transcription factor 3C polypeptide 3 (transcription factor C subunit 4)
MQLLILADLYNVVGEHENAIITIRKGCRWLQGRAEQKYWDALEDDREYDTAEMAESRKPAPNAPVSGGGYALDVNARHRLGIARLNIGDVGEGKVHSFPTVLYDNAD